MSNELEALEARVARLEAKEAVLSTLNRYLYSLDTGFGDDIIDCYTEDAVLDVPNFPDAGGKDLHFEGRAEIAPLYAPYGEREPGIGGGHHTATALLSIGTAGVIGAAIYYFFFMRPEERISRRPRGEAVSAAKSKRERL